MSEESTIQISYRTVLERVSDLNRSSFNYRFVFASIIAGYLTAISFITTDISTSIPIPLGDFYLLILFSASVLTLNIVIVIAFFDYIYQELIESSLQTAKIIEKENAEIPKMMDRSNGTLTSARISVSMFLFYLIPIFVLLLVVMICGMAILSEGSNEINSILVEVFCNGIQSNSFSCRDLEYKFLAVTKIIANSGMFFSIGMITMLFHYSTWRMYERVYLSISERRLRKKLEDQDDKSQEDRDSIDIEKSLKTSRKRIRNFFENLGKFYIFACLVFFIFLLWPPLGIGIWRGLLSGLESLVLTF